MTRPISVLSTSPRPLRRRPALLLALAASGGRRCARLLALRLGRARARRARLLCGSAPLYPLRGRFSSRAHAAARLLRCGPREPPHLEPVEGPGPLRLLRLAVAAAAAVVAAAAATAARQRKALADGDGEILLSRVGAAAFVAPAYVSQTAARVRRARSYLREKRGRRPPNGAGVRRIACADGARRTRGRGRRATPTRRPSSRRKCGSRCAGWCRRRAAARQLGARPPHVPYDDVVVAPRRRQQQEAVVREARLRDAAAVAAEQRHQPRRSPRTARWCPRTIRRRRARSRRARRSTR